MKPNIEELRKKYMENPPEGMTSQDIRYMSEDDLLVKKYNKVLKENAFRMTKKI